ncbi:MAG: hypothetical protein PHV68_10085, partial [Candidatus Gastranaerophilales bacterium]|nr:hypothetical protein [Candidatus Gastranaerophilales bacterium]
MKKSYLLIGSIIISLFFANISIAKDEPVSDEIKTLFEVSNTISKTAQSELFVASKKRVFEDNNNILSISYADFNIKRANDLIYEKKYIEAQKKLDNVIDWLENATEYHAEIYKALRKISSAKDQAEVEKDLAFKYAILRDRAYYYYGLIEINQKNYPKAVEYLVDVVRSQPKTDLGFSAYDRLKEIGFTYQSYLKPEDNK